MLLVLLLLELVGVELQRHEILVKVRQDHTAKIWLAFVGKETFLTAHDGCVKLVNGNTVFIIIIQENILTKSVKFFSILTGNAFQRVLGRKEVHLFFVIHQDIFEVTEAEVDEILTDKILEPGFVQGDIGALWT